MDYATLPPEHLILLVSKLNIKRYKSNSTSQIFYSCHASQYKQLLSIHDLYYSKLFAPFDGRKPAVLLCLK